MSWQTNPNHPTLPDVEPGTKGYGRGEYFEFKVRGGTDGITYHVTTMERNPGIFERVEEKEPKWPGPEAVDGYKKGCFYPHDAELLLLRAPFMFVNCDSDVQKDNLKAALRAVLKALGDGKVICSGDYWGEGTPSTQIIRNLKVIVCPGEEVKP